MEALEFAEEAAGLFLDPWQRWCVEHALAERSDGQWAAFEVGIVCPRQNGKNVILLAIQLACVYLFGDRTIVHSAHKFDTSVEHFQELKALLEGSDELAELLYAGDKSFITANGKEMIRFRTGQRILFKARTKGGSRGFTGDKVFLDEAFDLPAAAIGSMIPTLSTRPNPQVYYTSSAPHATSSVLHSLRRRGIENDPADQLFYAEWGNEDGVASDDVDAIRQANPGVRCGRISDEYILREIRTFAGTPDLVEEHFRERLGIASSPLGEHDQVISADVWASLVDSKSEIESHRCYALDVSPDRRWASFAAAGRRSDGRLHVEAPEHRPRTDWVLAYAVELYAKHRVPLRVDKSGPAASFIVPLREAGVDVTEVSGAEVSQACGQFIDAGLNDGLRHLDGSALNSALRGAVLRSSGDASLWARRQSKVDISALCAVTVAVGGVPQSVTPRVHVWNGGGG